MLFYSFCIFHLMFSNVSFFRGGGGMPLSVANSENPLVGAIMIMIIILWQKATNVLK